MTREEEDRLFGETGEGELRVRRATARWEAGGPLEEEWALVTTDSRVIEPLRKFGSREELDLVFAVSGREVGPLADSVAAPTERGGFWQTDWFEIAEAT